MGWGGGWGNHAPDTARTVAKAFYEGRPCKRGNCETDGMFYRLEGHIIAARENVALEVAYALQHDGCKVRSPHRGPTLYGFAGYPTKMTARHLCALGVAASSYGIKKPIVMFRGIEVLSGGWYTKEAIEALEPPPPNPKKVRPDAFVNMTMELWPT